MSVNDLFEEYLHFLPAQKIAFERKLKIFKEEQKLETMQARKEVYAQLISLVDEEGLPMFSIEWAKKHILGIKE